MLDFDKTKLEILRYLKRRSAPNPSAVMPFVELVNTVSYAEADRLILVGEVLSDFWQNKIVQVEVHSPEQSDWVECHSNPFSGASQGVIPPGYFRISLTAAGRRLFEGLQSKETSERPSLVGSRTVFISCGQWRECEKALGRALAKAVDELRDCKGYFAENQNSLESLSDHIFKSLNNACAFVAVMHPRGTLTLPDDRQHTRASVWVEQELAIAAFLVQAQGKNIETRVYLHNDIAREGVREQLLLNGTTRFATEQEVIEDFRKWLSGDEILCKKQGASSS